MPIRKTPSLYASGKWVLTAPYVADPSKTYTCMAIRSFSDITVLHEDVFINYYEPLGIAEAQYLQDDAAKVCIVTIMSESGEVIYVPDSYIESYPDISNTLYSHIVLSISLGALPDKLGLDFLKAQLENACGDVLGVTPDVLVHKSPSTGFVSAQDHANNEAARIAGITLVKSDYTRMLELQAQVATQQQTISVLVQRLQDLGEI